MKDRRHKEKADLADEDKHSDVEVIDTDDYWQKMTPNTPEARVEMQMHSLKLEEKAKEAKGSMNPKQSEKKPVSLFFPDGRPRNINEAKISFSLHDEQDRNQLVLDLAVPKYMDSSLLVADVQPTYAKFEIKGKIFQMVLPEEVKPDSSIAQRSRTTGHLVVTMPKLHQTNELIWKGRLASSPSEEETSKRQVCIVNAVSERPSESRIIARNKQNSSTKKRDKSPKRNPDWRNIVPDKENPSQIDHSSGAGEKLPELKHNSKEEISFSADILTELIGETMPVHFSETGEKQDFFDDPSVPPLV